MRTILIASIFALLAGGACKKDNTEKAGEAVRKNVEDVSDKREDVRDEQKDVVKEQQDVVKEQRELGKEQGELNQAKTNYSIAVKERLARLDARIAELDAKADAKSKDLAQSLRTRRDILKTKLDNMGTTAQASWNEFTKDVDGTFDSIEHDVNDALD